MAPVVPILEAKGWQRRMSREHAHAVRMAHRAVDAGAAGRLSPDEAGRYVSGWLKAANKAEPVRTLEGAWRPPPLPVDGPARRDALEYLVRLLADDGRQYIAALQQEGNGYLIGLSYTEMLLELVERVTENIQGRAS